MSSTTKAAPKTDGPTKKTSRTNQRAILETPVKFEGVMPTKKPGGRKSKLAPILETLKADPGVWYKIASGKIGTIYQTRARFAALDENVEAEAHADENDSEIGNCFARYNAPSND